MSRQHARAHTNVAKTPFYRFHEEPKSKIEDKWTKRNKNRDGEEDEDTEDDNDETDEEEEEEEEEYEEDVDDQEA